MADGSRNPGAASKSLKPPCPLPKGAANNREKAALLAGSSGDPFTLELARQQALIFHSKNGPLVSNRPVDPEGKHPISLHRLDKTTTLAPVKTKQRVTLIWKKQKDTLDTQATYFDSLDGDHRLLWDRINSHYEASVELTCGEHSGCLALSDSDLSADIQTFHVQPLTTGIQCITISMVKPDKPSLYNLVIGSRETKGAKREEEELQRIKELRKKEEEQLRIIKELRRVEEEKQQKSKEKLEGEIRSLSLILEKDKKRAAANQQLNECLKGVEELKGQLEREKSEKKKAIDELAGHRNEEKLRDLMFKSAQKKKTEYQPQIGAGVNEDLMQNVCNQVGAAITLPQKETPVRDDYVNLETVNQLSEYYIEYKVLEKSKEKLCKAKLESEYYSSKLLDYLHCEKLALMEELTRTKKELAESYHQITKLREIIRDHPVAPPIPARSPAPAPIPPGYVPPPGALPPGHATNPGYRAQVYML